jgi:hypothetical protein
MKTKEDKQVVNDRQMTDTKAKIATKTAKGIHN